MSLAIRSVTSKADRKAFLDLPYRLYANDPNWVAQLKDEAHDLITPGKNPWFEHGEAELLLAERDHRVVGRISAHIDHLAAAQPAQQGLRAKLRPMKARSKPKTRPRPSALTNGPKLRCAPKA